MAGTIIRFGFLCLLWIMITIVAPYHSPRLDYTVRQVFSRFFGMQYILVTAPGKVQDFILYEGESENTGIGFSIPDSGFLRETGLRPFVPGISEEDGLPVLFPQKSTGLSFDLFAAVFYMLSRYEEYFDDDRDQHGRLKPQNHIFYDKALHRPVVNEWLEMLRRRLNDIFPALQLARPAYEFIPTVDVDNGYAFRGKPFAKKLSSVAGSVLKGNMPEARHKIKVWRGLAKDHFDRYGWQKQVCLRYQVTPWYFMLCSTGSAYDHNIPYTSREYRLLVEELKTFGQVGLHPSYHTMEMTGKEGMGGLTEIEGMALEVIMREPVKHSRQHFLRFRTPETFRELLETGISCDWSMGYPGMVSFRSGAAFRYEWFDLPAESATTLEMIPLACLDVTFMSYMKTGKEEALRMMQETAAMIRATGGIMVTVWHDRNFSDSPYGKDWSDVWEKMIEQCR